MPVHVLYAVNVLYAVTCDSKHMKTLASEHALPAPSPYIHKS